MRQFVPNFFTLCNLLFGVFACRYGVLGDYAATAYCVACSAIMDVLDGAAARALRTSSRTGKDLDSLADVVSFGVAPALAAFSLLHDANFVVPEFASYSVLLLPVAAAYRLARFNQEQGHHAWFNGLPSPANGMFWASAVWYVKMQTFEGLYQYALVGLAILFSWLMVSDVRMYALKGLRSIPRALRFFVSLAIFSGVAFVFIPWQAVPAVVILFYGVLSILYPPKLRADAHE